ncbi:hypothetical protein D1872_59450 [compost metagenome]
MNGLFIGSSQILKQNTPGYPVHDQMVNRHQEMIAIYTVEQTCFKQRPFMQLDTALNFGSFRLHCHAEHGFIRYIPKVQHVQLIQLAFLYSTVPCFIALLGLAEHHSQSIMMLCQLAKRLTQSRLVKPLLPVQHNRLIKVMHVYLLLRKELVLDRKQRRFSAYFSLICPTTDLVHMRCQGCDDGIAEQILHVQLVAGLECTRYDLNRLDRIATQIKEIVQHTDGWHTQDGLPDHYKRSFRCSAWRYIIRTAVQIAFRCWQGLAVDFTVRCQRHLLQPDEIRRHHIAWQLLSQLLSQLISSKLLTRHVVRH